MSASGRLLERLDGVGPRGPGRWMARCPAHRDRIPSLSIREADDRMLLHCFAGCSAGDVLAAVGLALGDLYERPQDHSRHCIRDYRHVHAAREALKLLAHESFVVLLAAENLAQGRTLEDLDLARLSRAVEAIRTAREVAA
jgi:hypothetical protein